MIWLKHNQIHIANKFLIELDYQIFYVDDFEFSIFFQFIIRLFITLLITKGQESMLSLKKSQKAQLIEFNWIKSTQALI